MDFFKSFEKNIHLFKDLKIDLLIRGNTGILKGEILKVANIGILSPHHGDNRYFKEDQLAFGRYINKSTKSGFIIQEITSKLDDGNIIERQEIFTKETWWVNRYSLQQKSLNAWNNIFINLKKGKKLNFINQDEKFVNDKINKFPNTFVLFNYFMKKLLSLKYF